MSQRLAVLGLLAQAFEWPLELDDECLAGSCALQALQRRQPWLYRTYPPGYPPWMPPWMPPPSAGPETSRARTSYAAWRCHGRGSAQVPLAPTGWGMIADEEGIELGRLTTSKSPAGGARSCRSLRWFLCRVMHFVASKRL